MTEGFSSMALMNRGGKRRVVRSDVPTNRGREQQKIEAGSQDIVVVRGNGIEA